MKCPRCGFTQADFKKAGRLGCSECYKTFAEGSKACSRPCTRARATSARSPEALQQSRDLADRLKLLQKKLTKAVEDEDFEQAAMLRDEIKQIDQPPGQLAAKT